MSILNFETDEELWARLTIEARQSGFTQEQISAARTWCAAMQLWTADREFNKGLNKGREIYERITK